MMMFMLVFICVAVALPRSHGKPCRHALRTNALKMGRGQSLTSFPKCFILLTRLLSIKRAFVLHYFNVVSASSNLIYYVVLVSRVYASHTSAHKDLVTLSEPKQLKNFGAFAVWSHGFSSLQMGASTRTNQLAQQV